MKTKPIPAICSNCGRDFKGDLFTMCFHLCKPEDIEAKKQKEDKTR